MTAFDVEALRRRFPALAIEDGGRPVALFDGPGGTQVPESVIAAVADYYRTANANHDGPFLTSRRSDAVALEAHQAMADLLGAASPDEIKFGANMTTLTFHVSRSIAATMAPGDEIVVTILDHEGNVGPWTAIAADRGLVIRTVDIRESDVTLDLATLDAVLGPRTRLVAVGYASNAVGTINPVAEIIRRAHAVGAWT
ncbi:MAG: aminotransferase class V-fold PLP-dependent enzyme, partial [Candidatus Limnocylindrales bacterium]